MANLPETPSYEAGIYQIELTDAVIGGVTGISNKQARGLANRTGYLKAQVETIMGLLDFKAPLNSPALTGSPTAPTQAPGTNNTTISTTAFVQAALSAYATAAYVNGQIATRATPGYVDQQVATRQPLGDYATRTEVIAADNLRATWDAMNQGDANCIAYAYSLRPGVSDIIAWGAPGNFSWTVPPGVNRIRIRAWAGGGGGGGAVAGAAASGGTGGGYAETVVSVTPGQVIPILVGNGGTAGAASGGGGGTGGATAVGPINCLGGQGGYGSTGGVAPLPGSVAGVAAGGALNFNGSGGPIGFIAANGTPYGGAGGAAWGAPGAATSALTGIPGPFYGSGGGGGANGNGGGVGGPGLVVIEY